FVEFHIRNVDAQVIKVRTTPTFTAAKERHYSQVVFAAALNNPINNGFTHHAQSLTRVTKRIECTSLNQRLNRALVQNRQINPLTKIIKIFKRPTTRALTNNLVD